MDLVEHPTKAYDSYSRDLLTLVGSLEVLYVPLCSNAISPAIFFRRRRTSLDLSKTILTSYACGRGGTRAIPWFFEGNPGRFLLASEPLPPCSGGGRECSLGRSVLWTRSATRCFQTGRCFPSPRKKGKVAGVLASEVKPDER